MSYWVMKYSAVQDMLPAVFYEKATDPSRIDANKRFHCHCNYPLYLRSIAKLQGLKNENWRRESVENKLWNQHSEADPAHIIKISKD